MSLPQRFRELDNEARRTVRHIALVWSLASAITLLFFGPSLSRIWGRDIIRVGDAMFSVPSRTERNVILYRVPDSEEVLDLALSQYSAAGDPPIPPERWTEAGITKVCDRRLLDIRSPDYSRACSGQEAYPRVGFPPSFSKHPPWGSFPVGSGVQASADITLPLTERWGEIAQGAEAYLRSIQASPSEQLYVHVGHTLRWIVKALGLIVGTAVLLPVMLSVVFPPVGLALIALFPAVWFSREKQRLEADVAAATGHELAGSGDALRRGQAQAQNEPGHSDGPA
jgi:hypothetical protein